MIKKEKNMCRITFSPNIVQQARIATDGVLGDFIVRYDVQRDMGIGDIQVSLGGKLSARPRLIPVPCPPFLRS